MITRVLVANRAEIAARVFRTCRRLGIETVAVHSDADARLPYVREADVAVRLPGNAPSETYLDGALVLDAAERTGADAIHPGYGFLSENAGFARSVEAAGLTWIGPTPDSIEAMGSKIEAKRIMTKAGVPVLEAPADPKPSDLPLLVKASAGGGGRGMRIVRDLADLETEIELASAEAASAFGDGTVFVEPYVEQGRHVEVQVVGDGRGGVLVLGERDCSIQRRHQKVVEESPAPSLPTAVADALHESARLAAAAIDYRGAGTVEFLYDPATERLFFLEMNTRLQVEHPVTELVHGVDLVALQLAVAEGGDLPDTPAGRGHAIEVRLYAEDPAADHQPQSGVLTRFEIFPEGQQSEPGIRVDTGYESGAVVSTHYDAMLAKVVCHAPTRTQAARQLAGVLSRSRIHGVATNRDQLVAVLRDEQFLAGEFSTAFLEGRAFAPSRGPTLWHRRRGGPRDRRDRPRGPDRAARHPGRLAQRDQPAAAHRVRRCLRRVAGHPRRIRRRRVRRGRGRPDPGGPRRARRRDGVRRGGRPARGRGGLAGRARAARPGAPVHRPRRRGRQRQPARADARHGGECGGRGGGRGGRRSAGAGARGDEDAAHRLGAARRHGHRDRRTARDAGRVRRGPGSSGGTGMTAMFTETEERQELRKQVARLASKYGREWFTEKARSGEKTTELWLEIAKLGYLGINIPEEYGGGGGGIGDIAAVCEELAAQGCPLLLMVVSPAICGTIISRYGTEEQKQRWLPGICDGTGTMAFAITEPDAGTNTHNISTTARRDTGPDGKGSWVLNGRKVYISGVDEADHVLVVARAEDARTGKVKPVLFVVPTDAKGFEAQPIKMEIVSPELQFTVFLDDVRLAGDAIVGDEDGGLVQLFAGLNPERIMAASFSTGLARFALDRAAAYAKERTVFQAPIGSHQAIAHPLAQSHIEIELARLMTQKAAALFDAGDDLAAGEAANIAKYAAAEAACDAADRAVQTHGGNGITQEYGMAGLLVATRAGRIAPVSREMILNFVSMHSLGLPKSY